LSLPGAGVALAWPASTEQVNRSETCSAKKRICGDVLNSTKAFAFGKVPVIDGTGEGFDLGVGDWRKT
jgi:hypothetical protein